MTPDDSPGSEPEKPSEPQASASGPEAPKAKPRIHRMRIGLNVGLQLLLGLVIFGMVNYLGHRNYRQWDHTFNKNFTLADSTVDYLKKLTIPIKITVLTVRGTPVEKDISTLLEQYKKRMKNRLEVSVIDTRRDVQAWEAFRARRYQTNLKLESNGILVETATPDGVAGQRWIPEIELYEIDRERQTPIRFKGEALINSAIMGITSLDKPKFGIVAGSGRYRVLPDGTSVYNVLADIAAKHNFDLEPFQILSENEVPDSYSGLIWISPEYLGEREQEMLRTFFEKPGKSMLVMLNPENQTDALDQFLTQYGIQPRQDRVMQVHPTVSGPQPRFDVDARFLDGSELTANIVSQATIFLGYTRSLNILTNTEKQRLENIETKPLLSPSEEFWGEVDFRDPYPRIDEGRDHKAPLYIAASAERGAARDPRARMQSSRLIVFGNSVFADPDSLTDLNYDFLTRCLNWMLHRDVVAPNDSATDKLKATFRIQIKPDQWQRIFWTTTTILPLSALMLGLMLWSARRS